MVIFDSNIIIYFANGTLDRHLIPRSGFAHASVTKIETLGFAKIMAEELLELEIIFNESVSLPFTDNIVEKAIRLRQRKRMSLGDAIVAATAQEHDCELWTANTADFEHIDGLKLVNPLPR